MEAYALCIIRHNTYAFLKNIRKEYDSNKCIKSVYEMNTFFYIIIFITGLFFGSFATLAVYRIPRKEDILIKHSYCPNCNHKLGFFDLFPVFSFLLLGGKCRYCKSKIRARYLILELCSGITFLLLAFSMNISIYTINIPIGINLIANFIFISTLFILSGIDKERVQIEKKVIIFGYTFEAIYIIYQCILGNINVYQYVIYLLLFIVILLIDNIILRTRMKNMYYIDILYLTLYIILFLGSYAYVISAIITLFAVSIYLIIRKNRNSNICIGYFLCICTVITLIVMNFCVNYQNAFKF